LSNAMRRHVLQKGLIPSAVNMTRARISTLDRDPGVQQNARREGNRIIGGGEVADGAGEVGAHFRLGGGTSPSDGGEELAVFGGEGSAAG